MSKRPKFPLYGPRALIANNVTELLGVLRGLMDMHPDTPPHELFNLTDLPDFGGEPPADTRGIWSWDADCLLVGEQEDPRTWTVRARNAPADSREDLLRDALRVLNAIPRRQVRGMNHADTYALAAAIERALGDAMPSPERTASPTIAELMEDPDFAGMEVQPYRSSGDERMPVGDPTLFPRCWGEAVIQSVMESDAARTGGFDARPLFRRSRA